MNLSPYLVELVISKYCHIGFTRSHSNTEVKQDLAWTELGWETTGISEFLVLLVHMSLLVTGGWAIANLGHPTGRRMLCWCPHLVRLI